MSRERPFQNPTDGLVHKQSLVEGDLFLNLRKLPSMPGLDGNIMRIINTLSHQDYGQTASTVLTNVTEEEVNNPKRVNLIEFIRKWNAANQTFSQLLMRNLNRPNQRQQPATMAEVLEVLKTQTPTGDEPWIYNQLKSLRQVVESVEFGGLVGNTRQMERPVQTVFPGAFWVEGKVTLKDVNWLEEQRLTGATLNMYHLYLVAYEVRHPNYTRFPLGTRFQLYAASQGTVVGVMPKVAEHLRVNNHPRQLVAGMRLLGLSPNTAGIPVPFQEWQIGESQFWRARLGPPDQPPEARRGAKRYGDVDYGYFSNRKILRYIEGRVV